MDLYFALVVTIVAFAFMGGAAYATVQLAKMIRPLTPVKIVVVTVFGLFLCALAGVIVIGPVVFSA